MEISALDNAASNALRSSAESAFRFGSDRITFNRLRDIPLDFLKIDGRITLQIARDPVAFAKLKAIQRVCRIIGVQTIAEMVESEETLSLLKSFGVDYAQGFGVAVPRPFTEID